MTAAFSARVADGVTFRALDRALASPDARVALQAAEVVHDRLFGRPVALTETQLPGTQAYVELRRTLDALDPSERLAYLRESRMAAGIATHVAPNMGSQLPTHTHDPDPAPALVEGEVVVVEEEEGAGG